METIEYKKQIMLDKLYALHRLGIKPGLERTINLCEFWDNPHKNYKIIHIAGTNGKGTVASALASIFKEAGYNVGLYTSPHIQDFNERIRVNGVKISDEQLFAYTDEIMEFANSIGSTFFEITTAFAFKYFKDKNVDFAVIETGMGGRFDSTNVANPILSVITKIDYDHKEFLGDTIEQIAFEKAGIIKKNAPVVVSKNSNEVYNVIVKKAKEMGTEIVLADYQYDIFKYSTSLDLSSSYKLVGKDNTYSLITKLSGRHNEENLKTILCSINEVEKIERISISKKIIHNGLISIYKNTGLRGRIEMLSKEPHIFLDVAHNPNAVQATVDLIREVYKDKFNILFGVMQDKEYIELIKILNPISKRFFFTTPKIERSLRYTQKVRNEISQVIKNYEVIPNVEEALLSAMEFNENLLIIGSFYLAEEVLNYYSSQ